MCIRTAGKKAVLAGKCIVAAHVKLRHGLGSHDRIRKIVGSPRAVRQRDYRRAQQRLADLLLSRIAERPLVGFVSFG
jgi:hypothetical protein